MRRLFHPFPFVTVLFLIVAGCGGSGPLVNPDVVPREALTGRVVSAGTGNAVAGATVFVAGTTFQATTGADGSFFVPDVPVGGYTVGVYLPGYAPTTRTVTHRAEALNHVVLRLSTGPSDGAEGDTTESTTQTSSDSTFASDLPPPVARRLRAMRTRVERLEERVGLLSRQVGLLREEQRGTHVLEMNEKELDRFRRFFLGPDREKCRLLNPGALSFEAPDEDSRALFRVTADQPLEVLNQRLGYRLRVLMDQFTVFRYRGEHTVVSDAVIHFEPLSPSTDDVAERWRDARRTAYRGSRSHLLRALGAQRTEEEQFSVARLKQVERDRSEFAGGGTYTEEAWVRVTNVSGYVVPTETSYVRRLDLEGRYRIRHAGGTGWRLVLRETSPRFTILGQPLSAHAFGTENYGRARPICRRVPSGFLPHE